MSIIAINALSAQGGGGQTYIHNFLKNLPLDVNKIILITGDNYNIFKCYQSNLIDVVFVKLASKNLLLRTFWELFFLEKFLLMNEVDIYYAPGGLTLTSFNNSNFTTVTALRNMLPFDSVENNRYPFFSYSRFRHLLLRYLYVYSYNKSDKVIFISHYSKNAVKEYISDISEKSVVIYHGLSSTFKNYSPGKYVDLNFLNGREFYLYVSVLDVYKAQKEVIKSFHKLFKQGFKYPLLLVGPRYNKYGDEVTELIKEYGLSDSVFYIGSIDNQLLPEYYSRARALIFASSCECCPNILLEKLSSGKPIFCSNFNPMPEFGGDAPIYFNPYNVSDLYNKIQHFENNYDVNSQIIGHNCKAQSLLYDWKETVHLTINFLKK